MAEYSYTYDNGGTLSQMNVGSDTLTLTYDASGRPLALDYNGTTYYYVMNLQGDVTAILSSSGTAVVQYTYDAWGNPLAVTGTHATTLGTLNPLRYRGYVYDTETGFYYLQSRYYDPQIGRFINADIYVSTGQGLLGNNMFAYCRNNPVCRKDISGAADIDCIEANDDDVEVGPGTRETEGGGNRTIHTGGGGIRGFINGNGGNRHGGTGSHGPGSSGTGTKIYRYGYDGPEKLVPTENDVRNSDNSGLSFSTRPASGAAMTTIEEVNATGILIAVRDGRSHVSIYPINGTLAEWRDAGANSIWTQVLVNMVTLSK